jgi:diketogulonate reductase-like aldo/keto reductase
MEKVLKTGKTKAIGVANLSKPYLEELLPQAEVVPAVNQIENHPYLPQQEIVDLCKSKGILITAYSPFGSTGSPLFQEPEIQEAAKKHDTSPGAILLSYHSKWSSKRDICVYCANAGYSCTWKFRDPQVCDSIPHRREHEAGQA